MQAPRKCLKARLVLLLVYFPHTLNAGIPSEHVHRMLLALTPGGADVGPWAGLLGCCRPALDAESEGMRRAAAHVARCSCIRAVHMRCFKQNVGRMPQPASPCSTQRPAPHAHS
jgi:hypothetical protein